jgi:hypothetical protein
MPEVSVRSGFTDALHDQQLFCYNDTKHVQVV